MRLNTKRNAGGPIVVCAIVITSTTFLLASKGAVIVLKSEMLASASTKLIHLPSAVGKLYQPGAQPK